MKLKTLAFAALAAVVTACGHGFEGEYYEQTGSSNELLNAFAQFAGGKTIVIGSDFIDTDGVRTSFDDIFVRESGSQKYLIFKQADGVEIAWKIADDNTLVRGDGLVSVTLRRIVP